MSLPTLWHLHHHGYALQLVGKRWAVPLLAGCGWPVHTLPGTLRERARLLRGLARDVRTLDADFDKRLNTLLLTNSFSSALDAWLAGSTPSATVRTAGAGSSPTPLPSPHSRCMKASASGTSPPR